MRKATQLLGRLAILAALGAVLGCSGAEDFCTSTGDFMFPSHGECVSFIASLPSQAVCDIIGPGPGPGFGQCVSGLEH